MSDIFYFKYFYTGFSITHWTHLMIYKVFNYSKNCLFKIFLKLYISASESSE